MCIRDRYHYRLDYPQLDDRRWFVHVNLKKGRDGTMQVLERPVEPYVVPLAPSELRGYHELRIRNDAAASPT